MLSEVVKCDGAPAGVALPGAFPRPRAEVTPVTQLSTEEPSLSEASRCPPWAALRTQPPGMVLKCRFYGYSSSVGPACQEMSAVEKIVCYSQFP